MKRIQGATYILCVVLMGFGGIRPASGYTEYHGTMSDFIGANQNVDIDDGQYYAQFKTTFKWLRDYLLWSWIQTDTTSYNWTASWPRIHNFYRICNSNGINILSALMNGNRNGALNTYQDWWPYDSTNGNTGYNTKSYLERAACFGQLTARFGRTAQPSGKTFGDHLTALDYCRYFEDCNEPDLGWPGVWPLAAYAAHVSAVHDGIDISTNASHPLLGIKNGDPLAVHVQGGMAGANIKTLNAVYSNLGAARFKEAVEIINFHHYCCYYDTLDGDGLVDENMGFGGTAPEHAAKGLKAVTEPIVNWRNTYSPGTPIWCTEFGWDTTLSNGKHSDTFARNSYGDPNRAQANYLMRSYAILCGLGIQKAFMFMYRDPGTGPGRFSTSGVVQKSGSPPTPRTSYYYLAAMQHVIGPMYFDRVDSYALGSPWVFSYSFKDSGNIVRTSMLWCTKANTVYDEGITTNYTLIVPYMTVATQTMCINGSVTGTDSALTVINPGTANARVIVMLGETPIFVTYRTGTAAPVVTGAAGNIITNKSFTVMLDVDKNYGYWSTNGTGGFHQFTTNGVSITIARTTTLLYYGDDGTGNCGPTNTRTYTFDTVAPSITGVMSNLTTNALFTLTLDVNENYGYWSTNGAAGPYQQYTTAGTSVSVQRSTSFHSYAKDVLGNCTATNSNYYTITVSKPSVPTGISVVKTGDNMLQVRWTDTSVNEDCFRVYRSTNNTQYSFLGTAAANATSYDNTGLVAGIIYYYKVSATNEAGESAAGGPASNMIPLRIAVSNGAALVMPLSNMIQLRYSLSKNFSAPVSIRFSYAETASALWKDIPSAQVSGILLCATNSDQVNAWISPSIDTAKKYDIRIVASNGYAEGVFIISSVTVHTLFSTAADLGNVCIVNNPYHGEAGGVVFVNLTKDTSAKIYSISGSLLSEELYASNGRIVWDAKKNGGSSLSPGVYLCILRSSLGSRTMKVIVAK
ncbi:MAG: hypothetical protein HZC28_07065 [Spirochaetes bacterium]|nr:hypothetical protein [Spirochaetota bacterium]